MCEMLRNHKNRTIIEHYVTLFLILNAATVPVCIIDCLIFNQCNLLKNLSLFSKIKIKQLIYIALIKPYLGKNIIFLHIFPKCIS